MATVTKIVVNNPLCQLRAVDHEAEKDIFPPNVIETGATASSNATMLKQVQVYPHEKPGPVVLGKGTGLDIEVTVSGLSELELPAGKYALCTLIYQTRLESDYYELAGKDSFTFPVSIDREDRQLPGSVRALSTWSLQNSADSSQSNSLHLTTGTPIELFWLPFNSSADLPPFFANHGIPATLLRMFVPDGLASNKFWSMKSPDDWVRWIVEICHGIRRPVNFESQDSSKHWLKYDVFVGDSSFCGEAAETVKPSSTTTGNTNDKFDVDGWVKAYHNWENGDGVYTLVNCYDQAGAVEVILSLGYPHQWITWEYHQVYGFIKKASLVGRGDCNNPYYGNDSSLQVIEQNMDQKRSFFRNHAFLSIGQIHTPGDFFKENPNPITWDAAKPSDKRRILDACAGPHYGEFDREGYFAAAIETQSDVVDLSRLKGDKSASEGRFDEKHLWNAGITGTKDRTSEIAKNVYAPIYQEGFRPFIEDIAWLNENVDNSVKLAPEPNAVVNAFIDIVKANPTEGVPQQDYKHLGPRSVQNDGYQSINYSMWIPGFVDHSYMSMTITVCPRGDDAIEKFEARVALLTPERGILKYKRSEENAALVGVRIHIWGTSVLNLFVYKNVLVEVSKLDNQGEAIKVTVGLIKWLEGLPAMKT